MCQVLHWVCVPYMHSLCNPWSDPVEIGMVITWSISQEIGTHRGHITQYRPCSQTMQSQIQNQLPQPSSLYFRPQFHSVSSVTLKMTLKIALHLICKDGLQPCHIVNVQQRLAKLSGLVTQTAQQQNYPPGG